MTRVLPAMPDRIRRLPRNRQGYPVPWFVAWIDGAPDFRVIAPGKIQDAVQLGLCWVCGGILGGNSAFVIGPMCAVNRVSAEPPAHRDCGTWSAQACPFLTTPGMVRRDSNLPTGTSAPAGVMIARNPGVALVWVTRKWSTFTFGGGLLFDLGDPTWCGWYAQGQPATRTEVLASIDSGLPALMEAAVGDGPAAVAALHRQHQAALALIPTETP